MFQRWWTIVVWLVSLLVGNLNSTHAQPVYLAADCVETLAWNSSAIHLVTLLAIAPPEAGDQAHYLYVTAAPLETLKGEHQPTLRLALNMGRESAEALIAKQSRLIVVNAAAANPDAGWHWIDLADPELAVFTKRLAIIRDAEALIAALRTSVQAMPGVLQMHLFPISIPRHIDPATASPLPNVDDVFLPETRWAVSFGLRLSLPVDRDLEILARAMAASTDYSLQVDGLTALRFFKSDQNIAVAKRALQNQQWAFLEHPADNDGVEVRFYGVRQAAFQTLEYWGVPVERPQMQTQVKQ